jgi:hypothetical protein
MNYGPESHGPWDLARLAGFADRGLFEGSARRRSVVALQERAHAAGLLSERQSITDSKPFKLAKARLGVRSKRVGFGPGATWFWGLAAVPDPEVAIPDAETVGYGAQPSNHILRGPLQSEGEPANAVPLEWTRGVDLLKRRSRPPRISTHRWSIFIDDARRFLASPWAARAAKLGWDTDGLFASRFPNPHEHLGRSQPSRSSLPINCPAGSPQPAITFGLNAHQPHPAQWCWLTTSTVSSSPPDSRKRPFGLVTNARQKKPFSGGARSGRRAAD